MSTPPLTVLAINAGSSSIKFALYDFPALTLLTHGEVSGIGGPASCFTVETGRDAPVKRSFPIPERVTAVQVLVDWLVEQVDAAQLHCIAHRIVHGGARLRATQEVSEAVLSALYANRRDDPEHLPQELHLLETLRRHFPQARHVVCFDSTFHATMPGVASMLAVPRRYHDAGFDRLGFHGLSCEYLMHQLRLLEAPALAAGKVVLAHLGGGASVTAVEHGHSCDTSMGLTPSGGIAMSTRSGDIDPGFAWHCMHHEQMSAQALQHMLTHESGLRGISGSTGDMAQLLAREERDSQAAEAVALFCYQARKAVCAMAGALGGIDVLVFAGGIGEHAASVRARICSHLAHLGVLLDGPRNDAHEALISAPGSRVLVRIIRTDEQWMLAENARVLLGAPASAAEPSQ
jgi:acetate kinase